MIDRTKEKLRIMFGDFHRICIDNSLRYYAVGGTMLGILRHGGFIPWDDDIDVGMPRKDYNELMKIESLSDRYALEFHNSPDPWFSYPYAKMYDKTTTLIENTRHPLVRGIYIDIFPLDGIGDSKDEGIANYQRIKRLKKSLALRKAVTSKEKPIWKNAVIRMSHLIPDSIYNEKQICLSITDECERRSFDQCSFVGNMVGAWGEKEIMSRDVFGEPRIYSFEGTSVYGVEKGDEYLTNLYGDWRQLPPKEKQVSHHDYYLRIDEAYTGYIKK